MSYPITRLKNQEAVDKAEADFTDYYNEIDRKYNDSANRNRNTLDIQHSLYMNGVLSRMYYAHKYKDKSYDYLKIKMA